MQCSRTISFTQATYIRCLRKTDCNLVCSLEQESHTAPFMLSIHSPDNVFMVLVSIFISNHNHFVFSAAVSMSRHSGVVTKSNGLVHCSVNNAAVLCENYRERSTQIWTSPSEEEERKTFWPSGDFLAQYFRDAFSATGCVIRHENTQRWTVGCYNGL